MIRPAACLALVLALFLAPSPSAADVDLGEPVCIDPCVVDAPPLLPVVSVDGPLEATGFNLDMVAGESNPCPSASPYALGVIFQYPDYKGRWTTFCAARPCVWQEDGLRNRANYGVPWLNSVPFDYEGGTWDDRVSSMYAAGGSGCVIKLNEHPEYQGEGVACWNGGCEDVSPIDNRGSSLRFEYNP